MTFRTVRGDHLTGDRTIGALPNKYVQSVGGGTLVYIPLNNTEVDRKGREFYFWASHHNQLFQIQQMTQSVSLFWVVSLYRWLIINSYDVIKLYIICFRFNSKSLEKSNLTDDFLKRISTETDT